MAKATPELRGWIESDGEWHEARDKQEHHDLAQELLGRDIPEETDAYDAAHAAGLMHVATWGTTLHGFHPTGNHTGLQIERLKQLARENGLGAEVNQKQGDKHRQLPLRLAKADDHQGAKEEAAHSEFGQLNTKPPAPNAGGTATARPAMKPLQAWPPGMKPLQASPPGMKPVAPVAVSPPGMKPVAPVAASQPPAPGPATTPLEKYGAAPPSRGANMFKRSTTESWHDVTHDPDLANRIHSHPDQFMKNEGNRGYGGPNHDRLSAANSKFTAVQRDVVSNHGTFTDDGYVQVTPELIHKMNKLPSYAAKLDPEKDSGQWLKYFRPDQRSPGRSGDPKAKQGGTGHHDGFGRNGVTHVFEPGETPKAASVQAMLAGRSKLGKLGDAGHTRLAKEDDPRAY